VFYILKPSAWGGNGIQPDLKFRIEKTDGTILQSYNTNKIAANASPQWTQAGFFFTTAASTSDVVIRIINNSNGGCGNDLALDDITFRPCGPQISSSILGATGSSVSFCEGTSKSYTFTSTISTGFSNPVVQWQESINNGSWTDIPGATSATYTKTFTALTTAATYNYRLTAAETGNLGISQCRINSPVLKIVVASNSSPAATSNSPVCAGQMISISATGSSINWNGPNNFMGTGNKIDITNAQLFHAGKYYLVTVNGNCSRTDSIIVNVVPSPFVQIDRTMLNICEGDSVSVNLSGANNYTWQPSAGVKASGSSAWLMPADSTFYVITGTSAGCSDTASVQVNVFKKPEAYAGVDRTIMEGMTIQLDGSVKVDKFQFYWSPDYRISSLQLLNPLVSPMRDTLYKLTV